MNCNSLGDLLAKGYIKIFTGPFGSALHKHEYIDEGVRVIPAEAIFSDGLNSTTFNHITLEKAQDLKRYRLQKGDIVFARRGAQACGRSALVGDKEEGSIAGTGLIYLRVWKKDLVVPEYLHLAVSSAKSLAWLKTHAIGATMPNLNNSVLCSLPLNLPSYEKQVEVVNGYYPIIKKIRVNTKLNQTLEEIIQAIFKSWFVDFDPVKAKMNGDQPEGMDAVTASLFPEKLVESELGLIPEGWEVKPLDKVAHFQNGLALQKFRPESEDDEFLPVLKIAQLRQGYCDGKEKARTDIKESCRVYDGDMIFSWSGSLMIDLWTGGNAALNQHLFKVTSEEYNLPLYLFWTKHHLVKFQQIAKDKAVTMGHIKRGHLSESLCVIPPKELRDKMDEVLMPLINQGLNLRLQSNQLAALRDTLLPKLLSGEIKLETK